MTVQLLLLWQRKHTLLGHVFNHFDTMFTEVINGFVAIANARATMLRPCLYVNGQMTWTSALQILNQV